MNPAPDQLFRELFFSHVADLRAFVAVVVRSQGARDDVVLEVAQVLWEHFDGYDHGRPFGHWARSVAANKILLHQRMDPSFPARLSPEAIVAVAEAWDEVEEAEGLCARPEELAALERCLAELPPRSEQQIRLRYAEGRSVQEMAALGESSPEAVCHALGRLRARLRRCLQDRRPAPVASGNSLTAHSP